MISSLVGVVIFLFCLLLSVHVLIGLYYRSTVKTVAYDAARRVAATSNGTPTADDFASAESRARQSLGELGSDSRTHFDFVMTDSEIRVTIQVHKPNFLPALAGPLGSNQVTRTATARRELAADD